MRVLNDNQRTAIQKLSAYRVGALFMEPGTGKTQTAVELVRSIDTDLVVWLTPFQTKENLREEIEKCGGLNNLIICGTETLSSSDRAYLELTRQLEQADSSFIVCDESLKIKNLEAIRTQRIIELGKFAEFKLILNGTPITRNLLDVWAQFEFLSPKILRMNLAEFKNTFCEYTKMTKRVGNRKIEREWINKYHNVDYLYSLISPYVYEANLELDVHKQHIEVPYVIDDESKAEYKILKEKYLDSEVMQAKNNNIFLEMTQKMQHTYCVTPDKLTAVQNIVQKNPGKKILIFCKYLDSKKALEKFDVPVHTFGKSSFGLNLQDYNAIIYFDKTWDYAQLTQSEYRIYRTGQKENCVYYHLTGDLPLETLIGDNVRKKKNLLAYFKSLTVEQLKEIL